MNLRLLLLAGTLTLFLEAAIHAEVKVAVGFSASDSGFTFPSVPAPASNDAATTAQFSIVEGTRDPNGGDLSVLHDGKVPSRDDEPAANFFFRAGTDGGRIQIDLGRIIPVKQVGSYSWHAGARGPQVYKLYAADGKADGFQPAPKKGIDPAACGWQLIAKVDTRPKDGDGAGQHGVAITDTEGVIGKFRWLLFEMERTEARDAFGHTFYSEIDVIDASGPPPANAVAQPILKSFETEGGQFHFTIDATAAPDLADWAEKELKPIVLLWYPKIAALLPSEGYRPPANITFKFRNDMGKTPASAAGAGVNLNAPWFRGELKREACGAVVHELVHVVQNYWRPKSKAAPTPGWIIEGIADYVRWFLYEPQSRGAEITKRNLTAANYDSSYRITGNFLNWVTEKYDKELVRKLNAAVREGKYAEQLWKDWTGKTLRELGAEWKTFHEQRLQASELGA